MKRSILFILGIVLCSTLAMSQTARVQVIHNSADEAAEYVDIWLNNTLLLDNFKFRTASAFVDAPAGMPVEIRIKDTASVDTANPITRFDTMFADQGSYILVAGGILSSAGYSPAPPFTLEIFDAAREQAAQIGTIDVLVHHGVTDAPAVDVIESKELNATAVDNLEYSQFQGYLTLPMDDYRLRLTDSMQTAVISEFEAPLASLGLEDQAITVVASGFVDPEANSMGAPFGLFAVLSSGGSFLPLQPSVAQVQVIHNAADPFVDTVDVYINGNLVRDDMGFRSSTAFQEVPSAVELKVDIVDRNDPDPGSPLFSSTIVAEAGRSYAAVANGVLGTGFDPFEPFELFVTEVRAEASIGTNADVMVFHGASDAPTVDIMESEILNVTAVDNISYGEFSDYVELPVANYALEVLDASGEIVAGYDAPFADFDLEGAAVMVLASGFLDPEVNSDGPSFGLWVSFSGGGNMLELPTRTGVEDQAAGSQVSIYPNPALDFIQVNGAQHIEYLELQDAAGRVFRSSFPAGKSERLEVSDLPAGVYVLKVQQSGQTHIQKIVIR